MSGTAGTWELIRLIARRERVTIPVWVAVLAALPAATAAAFLGLYPTEVEIARAAAMIGGNPAFVAFLGPVFDLSLAGLTVWRIGALLMVFSGVVVVLTVTRHTRAEEQAGRRELLGATSVGRHAPLVATLMVAAVTSLAIGGFAAVGLAAGGLGGRGSVAFGVSVTVVTWLFATVTAFAAQLFESSRTVNGVGIGVVAGSFVLRVLGDAGSASGLGFLAWVSPIGLAQRLRPFAGERWWVAGVLAAVGVGLAVAAQVVSARRDVGAGVLSSRPGPATGALRGPLGLAWRLQRGVAISWAVGFALFGLMIGSVTQGFADLLAENPILRSIIEQLGGSAFIVDAFLASMMAAVGIVAAAHAVQASLWLRSEETADRVDPLLAAATPRLRWMRSHVLVGVGVALVDLTAAGAAIGLAHGATIGDVVGQVPRLAGAALAQAPAVLVLVGVAVACFGLVPRLSWVAWAVLGTSAVLTLLGGALGFDQWIVDLSPFSRLPAVPAEKVDVVPLAALVAVGSGLVAAGFAGFARRDIG